uniref:Uncharacterized protein n=1 Tax=Glossina palpalis gambiensis TaxID=67801 RepID=A0A1B0BJW4_9MUSC
MQGNAIQAVISIGMKQYNTQEPTEKYFFLKKKLKPTGYSYILGDIPARSNSIEANTPIEALLRLQGDCAVC